MCSSTRHARTAGSAARQLVLRKPMEVQESVAADLLKSLPKPPLATESYLGRNPDVYA